MYKTCWYGTTQHSLPCLARLGYTDHTALPIDFQYLQDIQNNFFGNFPIFFTIKIYKPKNVCHFIVYIYKFFFPFFQLILVSFPLNTLHRDTVCPRSSDSFYIVSYYLKWVTTSLTYSTYISSLLRKCCARAKETRSFSRLS